VHLKVRLELDLGGLRGENEIAVLAQDAVQVREVRVLGLAGGSVFAQRSVVVVAESGGKKKKKIKKNLMSRE
jgi:hypothetical protein